MRIFIYEYMSGGGCLSGGPTLVSLLREGWAMASALAHDFALLEGCSVEIMADAWTPLKLPQMSDPTSLHKINLNWVKTKDEEEACFMHLAQECEAAIIIAPEIEGILSDRLALALATGGHLICPSGAFAEIASDKLKTAQRLEDAGILTAETIALDEKSELHYLRYPGILKPRYGAGSQGLKFIENAEMLGQEIASAGSGSPLIYTPYYPGEAVSVSLLNGNAAPIAFPACYQRMSQENNFQYQGGVYPLPPPKEARAQRLAMQVVAAMPPTLGYFGIDMLLGSPSNGSEDRVIEINPRLTTSYLGLQAACEQNLADAWLSLIEGERKAITFRPTPLSFDTKGEVQFSCNSQSRTGSSNP